MTTRAIEKTERCYQASVFPPVWGIYSRSKHNPNRVNTGVPDTVLAQFVFEELRLPLRRYRRRARAFWSQTPRTARIIDHSGVELAVSAAALKVQGGRAHVKAMDAGEHPVEITRLCPSRRSTRLRWIFGASGAAGVRHRSPFTSVLGDACGCLEGPSIHHVQFPGRPR
jgi:hypothetical protein